MMIESNNDYTNEIYQNIKFPEQILDTNFRSCEFINVDFSACDLKEAYFEGCTFTSCDFSACIFSSYALKNDTFIACKLIGLNLIEVHLDNVLFKDSFMKYSNFSDSKLNNVTFDNDNLEESSFITLEKINKVKFVKCNLRLCDFYKTSLNKLDLRTCDIEGIKVDIESLRGLIVTPLQAVDLAVILGLQIKDE